MGAPDTEPMEKALYRAYARTADPDPARLAAILRNVEKTAKERAGRRARRWLPWLLAAAAGAAAAFGLYTAGLFQHEPTVSAKATPATASEERPGTRERAESAVDQTASDRHGPRGGGTAGDRDRVIYRE